MLVASPSSRGEISRLLVERDRLTGVELADGRTFGRTPSLSVHATPRMRTASWQGLVCELDESGFAVVDSTGRTSASGVWVAGNVISAVGAGAAAAIAINADLVEEDIANAVEAAA